MVKNKKRKFAGSANEARPDQPVKSSKAHKANEPEPKKQKQKPTIPFDTEDRILLIGEGDLSFAKSIVDAHGCCEVTATCLDSKDEVLEKYKPQAEEHIQYLEDEGQTILYDVDATKLDTNRHVKKAGLFDRIIFNFPHVGGKSKDVNRQVRFNQELLVKFFASALSMLSSSGTIVVTLFEGEPYTLWNIKDLARHSGLEVQRSCAFQADAYPGYRHSRTLGNIDGGGGWKGESRDARSYVFQQKARAGPMSGGVVKRKRSGASDCSSDEGG